MKYLGKYLGLKETKIQENGESYIVELHALYSPDIIRNLKLRRLRWAGYVAHLEEYRNVY